MWPFSKSLTHFQRGNRLFVQKDYDRAIHEFEAHAIAAPAESAAAFSQIAECYLHCNVLKQPQDVAPGITLVSAGDRTRAKEYFEKALAVDSRCLRALSGLADLLPEKSEDRKKLLERAVAVQPTYLTLLHLGDYYRSVDDDLAKAYEVYVAAQRITPRDQSAYQKLVDISKRLGDSEKEAFWKAERKKNTE